MCVLKAKEQALDEAFAADVTAFTKDEQKTAYLSAIQQRQKEYDEAKAEVDTLRQEMAAHKSGAIAARENLAISGDTLLSSSAALLYAGGDLSIIEKIASQTAEPTSLRWGMLRSQRPGFPTKTKPSRPSACGQAKRSIRL